MFGQGTLDWVPDFGGVVGFCVPDGGVGVVAGVDVVELVVAAEAPAIQPRHRQWRALPRP